MIVIDASVFNKLYLQEPDSDLALSLFRYLIEHDIERMAPNILLYEVCATALHYGIAFSDIHLLLHIQRDAGLRLIEPSLKVLEKAEKIAKIGNKKAGFPTLHDSIYHALAIEFHGIFVTADKRHIAKTHSFGAVCDLKDAIDYVQAR